MTEEADAQFSAGINPPTEGFQPSPSDSAAGCRGLQDKVPNPHPLQPHTHHTTFTLHQPQLHYKSKWSHTVYLQCVCSRGNAAPSQHPASSTRTDSALLTMPLIWLWQHLLRAGSQLPPANTHPRSLVQWVGPATCWQSICKDIALGTAKNSPGRWSLGSLSNNYRCSSYFYTSCENGEVRSTKAIAPVGLGLEHLLLMWHEKFMEMNVPIVKAVTWELI